MVRVAVFTHGLDVADHVVLCGAHRYNTDTDEEMSDSSEFEVRAAGSVIERLGCKQLTSAPHQDEDEDGWESDEMEMALQRDTLSPPEQVHARAMLTPASIKLAHYVSVTQDLRGIVGLVQGKGVKPVLCEVGGHNLNCCNLLLQVLSPLCNLGRSHPFSLK
jgi:hypothetical protein